MSETSFIVTLASDPRPGIIAAVATIVADMGGNITETHQHWDRPSNRFFLRIDAARAGTRLQFTDRGDWKLHLSLSALF